MPAKKPLTLSEKQAALRKTVAFPTATDWLLLVDDKARERALVAQLNEALGIALQECKDHYGDKTLGEIGAAIGTRIDAIAIANPDAGIYDSEGRATVACFFAINYDPTMYHFLRYHDLLPSKPRRQGA